MGIFSGLFKQRKSKIYTIQLNDMDLAKEVNRLIKRLQADISDLKQILSGSNISAKFAKMAELESSFRLIKIKLDAIYGDLRSIRMIEVENKDSIYLNDDEYLNDKIANIEKMNSILDNLLELVSERPSASDLREEFLEYISQNVNSIEESFSSIVNDDKQLANVYARIEEL